MKPILPALLAQEHIDAYAAISLSECRIRKPYLLEKNGFDTSASAVLMLLPYHGETEPENLSVYASVPDYHGYFRTLYRRLEAALSEVYPQYRFQGFTDHSPIDEVNAAAAAGLGVIGDNGLLISARYSSFVYLAELITDAPAEVLGIPLTRARQIETCMHCGACARACPSGCIGTEKTKKECLSAVTQKKGTLSAEEEAMIRSSGCVWGCDACQNACPYTVRAKREGTLPTPIPYFRENVIRRLCAEDVRAMSEEEFLSRPFSWRGRECILRNLELIEHQKDSPEGEGTFCSSK